MLTITSKALRVIERVTGHRTLDEASGVRIARRKLPGGGHRGLMIQAVNEPGPDDKVVERDGARLYVSPDTVERVDGAELDARNEPDGPVQFVLRT